MSGVNCQAHTRSTRESRLRPLFASRIVPYSVAGGHAVGDRRARRASACPPEDCGGIPGFYDLLDALADPDHEQHEAMRDWVGKDLDPQAFSIDLVNRQLAARRRRVAATRK